MMIEMCSGRSSNWSLVALHTNTHTDETSKHLEKVPYVVIGSAFKHVLNCIYSWLMAQSESKNQNDEATGRERERMEDGIKRRRLDHTEKTKY